jgi:hypothetical protein
VKFVYCTAPVRFYLAGDGISGVFYDSLVVGQCAGPVSCYDLAGSCKGKKCAKIFFFFIYFAQSAQCGPYCILCTSRKHMIDCIL